MPLKRRFFYSINNFNPPTREEIWRLGGYGFNTCLDRELARKSLQSRLPEKTPMIEIGRGIIRGYEFNISKNFQPFTFVQNEKGELTSFVQVFHVLGDACELGADYREIENLRKEDDEYTKYWVEYCPHNVDNLQQASVLLSLFTFWVNTMEAVLKLRHPQEQP